MTQRVQALLLAAGKSQRFGSDKRFQKLENGMPIVVQALRNLQMAVAHVVLVIKSGETQLFSDLLFSDLLLAHNMPKIVEAANTDAGMGASLACGMGHIDGDSVLVALADMPFVQPATIAQIANAMHHHALLVPHYRGRPGHPVGFQSRYFTELADLKADEGGKKILQRNSDKVKMLAVQDPGITWDIDIPADL